MTTPGNPETYDMQETAKMCGVSRKDLFALMRRKKIIDNGNLPYAQYVKAGYLQTAVKSYIHPTMGERARAKTVATPKGVEWLHELVLRNQNTELEQAS